MSKMPSSSTRGLDLPPRWDFLEQEGLLIAHGACVFDEAIQNTFVGTAVEKIRAETSWVKRLSFMLLGPSAFDENMEFVKESQHTSD